jgi:hypothetical protein
MRSIQIWIGVNPNSRERRKGSMAGKKGKSKGKDKRKGKGKTQGKDKAKGKGESKGKAREKSKGKARKKSKEKAKERSGGRAKGKPKDKVKKKSKVRAKGKPKDKREKRSKGKDKGKPKGKAKAKGKRKAQEKEPAKGEDLEDPVEVELTEQPAPEVVTTPALRRWRRVAARLGSEEQIAAVTAWDGSGAPPILTGFSFVRHVESDARDLRCAGTLVRMTQGVIVQRADEKSFLLGRGVAGKYLGLKMPWKDRANAGKRGLSAQERKALGQV